MRTNVKDRVLRSLSITICTDKFMKNSFSRNAFTTSLFNTVRYRVFHRASFIGSHRGLV